MLTTTNSTSKFKISQRAAKFTCNLHADGREPATVWYIQLKKYYETASDIFDIQQCCEKMA